MNGPGIYTGGPARNPVANQPLFPDANGPAVERTPLLPILLNETSRHTQTTAELVEKVTERLRSICSDPCPEPGSPEMKEEPLPAALELMRETVRRVIATNKRLERLLRQIEL